MRIRDAVAQALENAQGEYRSGEALARELGVSRSGVWKAIRELERDGFVIEARKTLGYHLAHEADLLTEVEIRSQLRSAVLGQSLYVLPKIPSTNDECRRLLQEERAPHGTVVVANEQTAGRGQHGCRFCSPPGTGLYFSVLLTQVIAIQDAPLLTACAAVAVARAIDVVCAAHVQIKWVNDLLLDQKKCCGILTEGGVSLESGMLEYAIVGIGINIRRSATMLPGKLCDTATSLEESCPECVVKRAELLAAVLYYLEQLLPELPQRCFLQEYRDRSCLIGNMVEIAMQSGEMKKAVVLDITDDCGLMIRDARGNEETLYSASASIKRVVNRNDRNK